jgi:hypothetical protein
MLPCTVRPRMVAHYSTVVGYSCKMFVALAAAYVCKQMTLRKRQIYPGGGTKRYSFYVALYWQRRNSYDHLTICKVATITKTPDLRMSLRSFKNTHPLSAKWAYPGKSYCRGRLSTVDLLVLSRLDQVLYKWKRISHKQSAGW